MNGNAWAEVVSTGGGAGLPEQAEAMSPRKSPAVIETARGIPGGYAARGAGSRAARGPMTIASSRVSRTATPPGRAAAGNSSPTESSWHTGAWPPTFKVGRCTMTERAERKLKMKMKRAWKKAVRMRQQHARAVARYKKLQRQYRAA